MFFHLFPEPIYSFEALSQMYIDILTWNSWRYQLLLRKLVIISDDLSLVDDKGIQMLNLWPREDLIPR